ncbi:MAG: formylglycine-generating enzyme family protein, partial [Candidatus Brocadiia bacterium]
MLRPIAVLLILACFALRMLACAEDVGIPASPISLVAISPGTFLMGSDISEERDSDEKPAHRVNISHAFYMGATEITQAQYTAVMTANPSYFKGDDLPVEQASWNDAVEFCRLLTEAERKKGNVPQGMEYRLPTEAEWEYCCRAGTTTDTFFGRDDWRTRDEYAWLGKNETHPVGKKKPNPWGLYDMYGNVWEWCHDWYGPYPQTANPAEAAIQSDPVGPAIGEFRVMRGIGWKYDYCGSTSRFKAAPTYRGSGMCGFRVVLAPPLVLPTGGKVTAGPLPLVFIKSGSFRMGSENGNPYEQPVFWAKMTKWFFIGATEVTQAQYRAVMGDNPSEFKGDDLPVESLRWDEAMEFCRLLTEQEHKKGNLSDGLVYRLPTEAEWEYSCRADAMGEYFFSQGMDGDAKLLGDYAWYEGNSEKKTHPVGTKKPNAWGLHDMHGNVWEWSLNWHSGSLKYGRDPIGWETGVDRSVRGGSWRNAAGGCRCAVRSAVLPYEKFNYLGFRVVVGRAIPQLLQQPIALVSIQPGTFMMGSEKGEPDEKPVHRVNI